MTALAPRTGPDAIDITFGGNRRPQGGTRARFIGTAHHGDRDRARLDPFHPAIVQARTLFPKSVVSLLDAPRVLVSGFNNAKLGARVEKGAWAGMPIFTLTLEERASCPAPGADGSGGCHHWRECFGNAMPFARRHRHGPDLVDALDRELREHARQNPRGFVVRLHVLGDFYEPAYVSVWAHWLLELPQLHVFGYSHRTPDGEIGDLIAALNTALPHRWVVRFSEEKDAPPHMRVVTLWKGSNGELEPLPPGSVMCPQSVEKTATCGTCGLCWAPSMAATRVAFVGHGMRKLGRRAHA